MNNIRARNNGCLGNLRDGICALVHSSGMERQTQIGFGLMIAAALLLPVADSLSKYLAQDFEPLQIVWARNLFHAVLFTPFVIWQFHRTA